MGITLDRGWWYYVKRVPKRFAHVDPRQRVTRALFTDSETEARKKAVAVEAEIMAYWESLAAGRSGDAAAAYAAARRLAAARGVVYRPAEVLADGPIDDLLSRLESLVRPDGTFAPLTDAASVLGAVPAPTVTVSGALSEFFDFTKIERLTGKSESQVVRWKKPRERAVATFIRLNGDLAMRDVSRFHAQAVRDHWAERITSEGVDKGSANKDIGHLSDLFRSWAEYHQIDMPNPFDKLRFRGRRTKTVGLTFSDDFIRNALLADGALDGLNEEARDVLLVMVNTGARPSEILGCALEAFQVAAKIPHLDIGRQVERVLKTETAPRQIPLLGVSLNAARRIARRGGISRYLDKYGWLELRARLLAPISF